MMTGLRILVFLAAAALSGCGGDDSGENSPAGVASRFVAACRDRAWDKAAEELSGLSPYKQMIFEKEFQEKLGALCDQIEIPLRVQNNEVDKIQHAERAQLTIARTDGRTVSIVLVNQIRHWLIVAVGEDMGPGREDTGGSNEKQVEPK